MEGFVLFNGLFDQPMWALVLGGFFGLFCVALFANLHKSSAGDLRPKKTERTQRT